MTLSHFRESVRRALADADGGPLGRRIRAATITAIIADARGDVRDAAAIAELVEALERAGVPRGRQFVLLGSDPPDLAAARDAARSLRASLGIPVLAHDPAGRARFLAGTLESGVPVELDDELREAEEVVLAGRFAAGESGELRGGPALLWPGLASARARAARSAAPDAASALAEAASAMALAPVDFALVWSAHTEPRVRAGTPGVVFAACVRDGWLATAPDAEARKLG